MRAQALGESVPVFMRLKTTRLVGIRKGAIEDKRRNHGAFIAVACLLFFSLHCSCTMQTGVLMYKIGGAIVHTSIIGFEIIALTTGSAMVRYSRYSHYKK